MAFARAVPVTTISLAAVYRRVWCNMAIQLEYDTLRMMGDYLAAARMRYVHSWLRLSGPVRRLP